MIRFSKRLFICPTTALLLIGLLAVLGVGFHPSPTNNKSEAEIPLRPSKTEPRLPASQGGPQKPAKPERLSPFDIESLIGNDPEADLRDVWAGLGISGEVDVSNHHLDILHTCHDDCKTEMYEYDLDGEPGKEILLRVEDRFAEDCRYLIFKQVNKQQTGDDWKLLGYIDHGFGRYQMPQHSIVISGGQTWLLIEFQEGSGSGYAYYENGLFRVTPKEAKALLYFPSEGSLASWGNALPTREFSSRVLNCEEKGGRITVEIELVTSYQYPFVDSDDGEDTLWKKTQRAVYTSRGATGEVALDLIQSTVSEEELADVFGCEGLSYEAVLEYNNENLTEIATGNNLKHKEWLRQFLKESPNTEEKDRLQKLLDR